MSRPSLPGATRAAAAVTTAAGRRPRPRSGYRKREDGGELPPAARNAPPRPVPPPGRLVPPTFFSRASLTILIARTRDILPQRTRSLGGPHEPWSAGRAGRRRRRGRGAVRDG